MEISKQDLVVWLKTQRHQNGKLGKIGYMLHELGIWGGSKTDMEFVKRAYAKHMKGKVNHGRQGKGLST